VCSSMVSLGANLVPTARTRSAEPTTSLAMSDPNPPITPSIRGSIGLGVNALAARCRRHQYRQRPGEAGQFGLGSAEPHAVPRTDHGFRGGGPRGRGQVADQCRVPCSLGPFVVSWTQRGYHRRTLSE
jgi:hypothetical protein